MDFNALASQPQKGKTVVVHPDYVPFLTELAKSVRFDYTANTALAFRLGMVSEAAKGVTNAGTGFLKALPVEVQHHCCTKKGTYSDAARLRWANPLVDLTEVSAKPVVTGLVILTAYDQWKEVVNAAE